MIVLTRATDDGPGATGVWSRSPAVEFTGLMGLHPLGCARPGVATLSTYNGLSEAAGSLEEGAGDSGLSPTSGHDPGWARYREAARLRTTLHMSAKSVQHEDAHIGM